MEEASHNNPDIIAALRAWQAAAQVPSQVSTLPNAQVTIQQLGAKPRDVLSSMLGEGVRLAVGAWLWARSAQRY